MSFLETPRFPECVSFGMQAGPTYSTDVVVVRSGRESRLARREDGLLKFDVSFGVQTKVQLDLLVAHFRAVKGRAHGFRLKDWSDYTATLDLIGTGVGTGASGPYQLNKVYTRGALSETRAIVKPVSTPSIYLNTVLQVQGRDYIIDLTTGLVTFTQLDSPGEYPGPGDLLRWSGEFDVPARFDTDEMQYQIISEQEDGKLLMSWQGVPVVEVKL